MICVHLLEMAIQIHILNIFNKIYILIILYDNIPQEINEEKKVN